jgi:hypothetical protein
VALASFLETENWIENVWNFAMNEHACSRQASIHGTSASNVLDLLTLIFPFLVVTESEHRILYRFKKRDDKGL